MATGVAPSRELLLGTENADGSVAGVLIGQSVPLDRSVQGIIGFFMRSLGTTSGGTIVIEEADWGPGEAPYSGTWSAIQTIAASTFSGGAQLAVHITDSAYGWVRVRISSPITGGGTITAAARQRGAA